MIKELFLRLGIDKPTVLQQCLAYVGKSCNRCFIVISEDVIEPQGYGRIEYAYYIMNKKIDIMPSQLLEYESMTHFITERFDTVNNKDYHIQPFGSSLANLDFNTPQDVLYFYYFTIIKGLNMSYKYILEDFTRMLFNIIGKNYGDHVKNLSFKMDKIA